MKKLKYAIVIIGVALSAFLAFGPTVIATAELGGPQVEPVQGQRAVAVFVLAVALWATNVIPLAATSLLALGLLPLLGVMEAQKAFAYFGNEAVFFILGVFILAAAMIDTGLSKRMTLVLLHRFDRTPRRLIGGVLFGSAALALCMPEHAVAAMMFPVVLEVAQALQLKKHGSGLACSLFLALAWGSVIGGVGTFLGGARVPLALEIYRDSYSGQAIGFVAWMGKSMPVVVILTAIAYVVLGFLRKHEVTDISAATRMLTERVEAFGRLSGRELRLAALGILTLLAWIGLTGPLGASLFGKPIGLATISMLAAAMVFVLRICDWRDVQAYINWGVVVMYGGAVAVASALKDTRAAEAIAASLMPDGLPPVVIFSLMALAAMALTETISNVAAVAVLLPLGFGFCEAHARLDPVTMVYAVTIGAGLAFTLPMSSPPNAIAFSSGYYGMRQVVRAGLPLNLLAFATLIAVMLLWWPVVGLKVW